MGLCRSRLDRLRRTFPSSRFRLVPNPFVNVASVPSLRTKESRFTPRGPSLGRHLTKLFLRRVLVKDDLSSEFSKRVRFLNTSLWRALRTDSWGCPGVRLSGLSSTPHPSYTSFSIPETDTVPDVDLSLFVCQSFSETRREKLWVAFSGKRILKVHRSFRNVHRTDSKVCSGYVHHGWMSRPTSPLRPPSLLGEGQTCGSGRTGTWTRGKTEPPNHSCHQNHSCNYN